MSQSRVTRLVALWLVIALGLASFPASAAAPAVAGSHFVRIPAEYVGAAAGLGLRPAFVVDYGGFHWLELGDADLARLVESRLPFVEDTEASMVHVRDFAFDPLREGEPSLPPGMQYEGEGTGLHLIQFRGPIHDAWLAELQGHGLPMLQYYPNNAYLTWGTGDQIRAAQAHEYVRWSGRFHPGYKINGDLNGRTGLIENVDVTFYAGGGVERTLAAIQKLGGVVRAYFPSQPDRAFFDAIVAVDAAALNDLAQLDTVLAMSYSSPEPGLDDEMSSQIVAGNYTGGIPFVGYQSWLTAIGLNGTGVIWSITDTGVDYQHPDLGTHISGGHDYPGACSEAGHPGSDCPGQGHGTHVAGIVGGDATGAFADPQGFKYGLGIAPEVGFFAQNSLSAPAWPPAGGWQEHSKWPVLGGAVGANNSWTTGEGTNHGYQASERTHDMMVQDGNFDTTNVAEPFMLVFSAGNSGPGGHTLTSPKEAKNIVTVASSRNYRVGSIDAISSFSSRGPAVDNRIKPDVAAPGEQISSAYNDTGSVCGSPIGGTNNLYVWCSGTSMAAPHVSGALTLITEWWRAANGGANPSQAMAKAILINGAVDMGTPDIPNASEGWGRIHLTNVFSSGLSLRYYDQTRIFNNTGESWTVTVGVADPTKPLKITLVWTDAPGAVGANPALVNNLDLTVVNGANTYYGNHFTSGWSTPGGSPDTLNNVENVYIQNPAGSATITVGATNIAGDGVLYNGDPTDQHYALVCRNCALEPDFTLAATPAAQTVCAPASAAYTVDVGQVLGYNAPVTLSNPNPPPSTGASFSVNPVTPPGTSILTVGPTGSTPPGTYTLDVVGTTATKTHTTNVDLTVYAGAPGAPALVAPPDGATGVSTTPTFQWNAGTGGGTYHLQVATDSGFTNLVIDEAGLTATSFTSGVTLNTGAVYYWRVSQDNACGTATSSTFSFTTVSGPGDCAPGQVQYNVWADDMESGVNGWTTGGTGSTWIQSTARSHSPTHSWFAQDVGAITDQRLIAPAVTLPTGRDPLSLKFWHYRDMEESSTGCFDGGIMEISTDGGTTWTQLVSQILTDPYDGTVSSSYGNPLAGLSAWCGLQDWTEVIVDLTAFAGQSANLRWREGTDSSVSAEGWYVDDVRVQACLLPTATEVSAVRAASAPAGLWLIAGLVVVAGAALFVLRRRA